VFIQPQHYQSGSLIESSAHYPLPGTQLAIAIGVLIMILDILTDVMSKFDATWAAQVNQTDLSSCFYSFFFTLESQYEHQAKIRPQRVPHHERLADCHCSRSGYIFQARRLNLDSILPIPRAKRRHTCVLLHSLSINFRQQGLQSPKRTGPTFQFAPTEVIQKYSPGSSTIGRPSNDSRSYIDRYADSNME
jgi:hypothetical protein